MEACVGRDDNVYRGAVQSWWVGKIRGKFQPESRNDEEGGSVIAIDDIAFADFLAAQITEQQPL
jgi:hypothetical protein